jgi:conjugal transfer pilus assembly protein TraF
MKTIGKAVTAIALLLVALSPVYAADSGDGAGAAGGVLGGLAQPELSEQEIRKLLRPGKQAENKHYWKGHSDGWWWYKDPEDEEDFGDPKAITAILDSQRTVEDTRRVWQAALNTSLMHPTPDNIERMSYAKLWFVNRAEYFANAGVRTRWENADFEPNVQNPSAAFSQTVTRQISRQENETTLANLGKQGVGVFFFMTSTCPYCEAMSPVMKNFERRYGISVVAVTLDGAGNREYPNAMTDNGISDRVGVTTVPAYVLVDPNNNTVMPIGAGVMAENEMVERIYMLTQREAGQSRR